MEAKFDNFSLQEAMRMASTPAGQRLIAMLRQGNDGELRQAMEQASSGDYETARKTLSQVLSTPEAQELLRQLRG